MRDNGKDVEDVNASFGGEVRVRCPVGGTHRDELFALLGSVLGDDEAEGGDGEWDVVFREIESNLNKLC